MFGLAYLKDYHDKLISPLQVKNANIIKKDFPGKVFFMVEIKRRSSNFLSCIKELIEELKKSDTV